ncbi:MAG TPA: hypothetical protein VIJ93_00810, partial [bacterium]
MKPEFEIGPASEFDLDSAQPLRSLFRMAMRQRGLFISILALAGFSSLLMLLQPILYREAVNDVAGVFVGNNQTEGSIEKIEESLFKTWTSKKP